MGNKKKRKKWYEREVEKRITRYEAMPDDEFISVYKKEMFKNVSLGVSGILILFGCVVVLVLIGLYS